MEHHFFIADGVENRQIPGMQCGTLKGRGEAEVGWHALKGARDLVKGISEER